MTKIGLRSVVNAEFIKRFSKLAGGGADPTEALRKSITGGGSSGAASFASTLRSGAQIYSRSVAGVNAVISFVNIAQGTLEKIGEITESLVEIVQKAVRPGVGRQTLRRLQTEFNELGVEFRDVMKSAQVGGSQLLTVEGLSEIFTKVGLDPDKAVGLAEIFSDLALAEDEDSIEGDTLFALASERIRGERPFRVPRTAGTDSVETVTRLGSLTQLTSGNVPPDGGLITDALQITEIIDEDSGEESIHLASDNEVFGAITPGLTSSVNMLSVNQANGYSIFNSTDDFLGQNGGGAEQLFLADEFGNVLHQLTANNSVTTTYSNAGQSADSKNFVYSTFDSSTNTYQIRKLQVGSFGTIPGGTDTLIAGNNGSISYKEISVNLDGTRYAYVEDSAFGADTVRFNTFSNDTPIDSASFGISDTISGVGFISSDTIVIGRDDGNISSLGSINISLSNYAGTSKGFAVNEELQMLAYFDDAGSVNLIGDGYARTIGEEYATLSSLSLRASQTDAGFAEVAILGDVSETAGTDKTLAITSFDTSTTSSATDQALDLDNDHFASSSRLLLSDVGIIAQVTDSVLLGETFGKTFGYNPGRSTIITRIEKPEGVQNDLRGVSEDVQLMAADAKTGRAVIQTTQDFLGNGTAGFNNLFIVDEAGRVVQQLTNNLNANVSYTDVAMPDGALSPFAGEGSIVFVRRNELQHTTLQVQSVTLSNYTNGPSSPVDEYFNFPNTIEILDIQTIQTSDDETRYILNIWDKVSDEKVYFIAEVGNLADYKVFGTDFADSSVFFIDENTVGGFQEDGLTYNLASVDVTTLVGFGGELEVDSILYRGFNDIGQVTARAGADGGSAYIAVQDTDIDQVSLFELGLSGGSIQTNRLGIFRYSSISDSLDTLSLAKGNTLEDLRLGMFGELSSVSGDNDGELYSLQVSSELRRTSQFSRLGPEVLEFFSGDVDLRNRANSLRLLEDLKTLQNQVESNLEGLAELSGYLGGNLELLRATGLSMLELSDQIGSLSSADAVANALRKRIRENGTQAVNAHSGNLLELALAAVAIDDETFNFG